MNKLERTIKEIAIEYLGALVIESKEVLVAVVKMWNSKLEHGVMCMLEEDTRAYHAQNETYYDPAQHIIDKNAMDYAKAIIRKARSEVVTCGDINDCTKCNKENCKDRTKEFNNKCVGCKHWWEQYAQCLSGTGCIK